MNRSDETIVRELVPIGAVPLFGTDEKGLLKQRHRLTGVPAVRDRSLLHLVSDSTAGDELVANPVANRPLLDTARARRFPNVLFVIGGQGLVHLAHDLRDLAVLDAAVLESPGLGELPPETAANDLELHRLDEKSPMLLGAARPLDAGAAQIPHEVVQGIRLERHAHRLRGLGDGSDRFFLSQELESIGVRETRGD